MSRPSIQVIGLSVAVLGGVLTGHQVLDRDPQHGGREGMAAQARIRRRDRPPFSAAAHLDDLLVLPALYSEYLADPGRAGLQVQ